MTSGEDAGASFDRSPHGGSRRGSLLRRASVPVVRLWVDTLESREFLSATYVAIASSTAPSQAPILKPSHIVVVFEEDRAANAIGDVANMPYFNQLASTGLVYGNSHGLNTTSQEGQMSYLGLYSGSTQGVTDDANNGVFAGPNLAQSLANKGKTFSEFAESLPHAGDTTDDYAADPSDPDYDDLYVRAYNPAAQFTNAGTGVTNAKVNQPFSSFPTTAAGYASLPTVSFVTPNTLHNTHGSNDTDPFATDPGSYNLLRHNADTWLKQNLDSYLQWAKQNNSLLIVTDDEGDRAHNFNGGFATIVNGDSSLFVPGSDSGYVTPYNILRTIENMYVLPDLGNSATVSGLDINSSGQLSPPHPTGSSVVGQPVTFNATVLPTTPSGGTPTGTVQFVVNGVKSGSPVKLANGSAASAPIPFTASTSYSVSAVYSSDPTFSASTSPTLLQSVSQDKTSATLASTLPASVWGQSITFTATVTPTAPGAGTPSGNVKFMDGSKLLGTVTLSASGKAAFTTSTLAVTMHSLTAVYSGDASFVGTVSAAIVQHVNADSTSVALVSSTNPAKSGQNVTLTATVSTSAPAGAAPPTGKVTFFDGSKLLGSISLNGALPVKLTTAAMGAGLRSVTAVYTGDANYLASTSPAVMQIVVPPNDNFANATALSGSSASVTGATNVGASKEPGEPAHGGNAGGKSVWWTWKAPTSGVVSIDTAGSNFNTLLAVYTGTSVSALKAVPNGSNDNDPAGSTHTSKVSFAATAGTVYHIAVDGFGGASGLITLHLALFVTPAAPTALSASKATYTNKVHLTWTAPTGATAYEVWRGTSSSTSSAKKISATDVTTTTYDDTTAVAGITYWYWVKAKNIAGTSGFSASSQGYLEPANDKFANAAVISGTIATVTGTNFGATKETGEPAHAGNAGGKSVWWIWKATKSGTLTLDTHGSNFNTLLAVYTGSSVSTLTAVPKGSDDNDPAGGTATSKVSCAVTGGITYRIAIDGSGGASGNITLHLSLA